MAIRSGVTTTGSEGADIPVYPGGSTVYLDGSGSFTTPAGGGASVLDVETEIDPLHLYRPIDDATHTVLVGGKVDTLKDISTRGATLDLTQTTDANRFTQGTDGGGKEFMRSLVGDAGEIWLDATTAADWSFMHSPGGLGCTLACVVEIEDVATTQNNILGTTIAGAGVGAEIRLNGSAGTVLMVPQGPVAPMAMALYTDSNKNNGTNGVYSFLARYRDLGTLGVTNATASVEGETSVNGTRLLWSKRLNDYASIATDPDFPLRVGAMVNGTNGIIGKIYEVVLDDRYWSDELVRRYHARGVSEYGAGNMIR